MTDEVIKAGVAVLHQTEGLDVEPSATAGLTIPWRMMDHLGEGQGDGSGGDGWDNATHLVWLTGGAMVPAADHEHYLAEGLDLLPRLSS